MRETVRMSLGAERETDRQTDRQRQRQRERGNKIGKLKLISLQGILLGEQLLTGK